MDIMKTMVSAVVSIAVVAVVTAILWYAKVTGIGPHHPIFFYLLPIALLAIQYGARTALICAIVATFNAAYFLYDPIYSFRISGRLEIGDLICFTMLALIGVKCIIELLRPSTKINDLASRYGRTSQHAAAFRIGTRADPVP